MLKLKLINKPQLFKLKCNFSFPDVILGKMQEKTIIPSKEELEVSPDPQYDGLSKVTVKKIPDEYIIPSGNVDITENGTYNVTDKANATVKIPNPNLQEKTLNIVENGTTTIEPDSDFYGLSKVITNVSIPEPKLEEKNIIANGTYNANDEDLDGYNKVIVNVPEKTLGTKTIISNGTYKATDDNFDGYSQVDVNVPSQGWKPNSTWWDIDKILEDDTEDFPGKCIVLYSNINKTTYFTCGKPNNPYPQKIKTSDGAEYTYSESSSYSSVTHTWDKTKDKISNLEYSTRYAIYYFDNNDSNGMQIDNDRSKLYVIIDNAKIWQRNSSTFNNPFYQNGNLECVKFQNGGSLGKNGNYNYDNSFYYCYALKELSTLNLSDPITSADSMFTLAGLEEIPNINTSQATDLTSFTSTCRTLKKIKSINLNSITSSSFTISSNDNLSVIENISNIKVNFGVSGSPLLSHDTLIRILNALVDLTGQTSKTLTLGTINKTKLADNELEIATNKNWVVN